MYQIQEFKLSTHLTLVPTRQNETALIHRWTGTAVKANPELLEFLKHAFTSTQVIA
jgi:hypothetical protein